MDIFARAPVSLVADGGRTGTRDIVRVPWCRGMHSSIRGIAAMPALDHVPDGQPGRYPLSPVHWHSAERSWHVLANGETAGALLDFANEHGLEVECAARARLTDLASLSALSAAADADIQIESLGIELAPGQRAATAYAMAARRAVLGDPTGDGKTVCVLAALHGAATFPAVVVCGGKTRRTWGAEVDKVLPTRRHAILRGTLRRRPTEMEAASFRRRGEDVPRLVADGQRIDAIIDALVDLPPGQTPACTVADTSSMSPTELAAVVAGAEILLVNYDIVNDWIRVLRALSPQAVVFDEPHTCISHDSLRAVACKELARGVRYRYSLTATMMVAGHREILLQTGLVDRLDDLGGFWYAAHRYCDAHKVAIPGRPGETRWEMGGATHGEELRQRLRALGYTRREKLTGPPERVMVPVILNNRDTYDRAVADPVAYAVAKAVGNPTVAARLDLLAPEERSRQEVKVRAAAARRARSAQGLVRQAAEREICGRGKLAAVLAWVADKVSTTSDKVIVFTELREFQRSIQAAFPGSARIAGEDSEDRRFREIERFQTDPSCRVIVCSANAGRENATLTAGNWVVVHELPWSEEHLQQYVGRADRRGQSKPVHIVVFHAPRTVDDRAIAIIDRKHDITSTVVRNRGHRAGAPLGSLAVGGQQRLL